MQSFQYNNNTSAGNRSITLTATDQARASGDDVRTVNFVNSPPILDPGGAIGYENTPANDTFMNITRGLSGSDADAGDTLTYGIDSGTTGGADTIDGVTYDVSKAGSLGELFVKSDDGQLVFVPNAPIINATSSDQSDTFTVT